jgi:cytochrome bd-type quinol oxidase subunit 2
MSHRAAAWLAGILGLLGVVLAAGTLLLAVLNGRTPGEILIDEGILTIAILVVAFSVVGAVISSHRPQNAVGWLFCCAALFQALSVFTYEYAIYALITKPGSLPLGAEMSWMSPWIWAPGLGLILVFVPLLFPDGRLLSRRWRPVAWLGSASIILICVPTLIILWPKRGRALLGGPVNDEEGPARIVDLLVGVVAFPLMLVAGLAAVISLFVRFRRARGEERQQIKWFASAAALTLLVVFLVEGIPEVNRLFETITAVGAVLVAPSIPVATGIAILRYRLYDIDLLINRTLVYGSLTATLVAVYVGTIVVLQGLLRALTGQESQLAIVASTLAIAALFNPLRRRVQAFVDRRFYRKKYDARKTLEAFSAKLRDETNLDALSDDLVGVVRETMQPAHVSLWLRPETSSKGKQTD